MSTHQVLGLLSVGTSKMLSSTRCHRWYLDSTANRAFNSRYIDDREMLADVTSTSAFRIPAALGLANEAAACCARCGSHISTMTLIIWHCLHLCPRPKLYYHAHLLHAGLSLVLVVMYGLRPFLVAGQKHAPSPLLGPQKVGGIVTIAAGWTSVFLGCVVIHQAWVRAAHAHFPTSSVMHAMQWGPIQQYRTLTTWRPAGMATSQGTADPWELCRLVCTLSQCQWTPILRQQLALNDFIPCSHQAQHRMCWAPLFSSAIGSGIVTALKFSPGPTPLKASRWTTICIERCQKEFIIGGGSRSHHIPGVTLRLGPSTMNVLHVAAFVHE